MSASGLPTATELQVVTQLPDLLNLLNVGEALWTAFTGQAGDPGVSLRVLAALPQGALRQACLHAVSAGGEMLTPIQAAHVGLVWRSARKKKHLLAVSRFARGSISRC